MGVSPNGSGNSYHACQTWVCSLTGKASALQAERCRYRYLLRRRFANAEASYNSDQNPLLVSKVEVVETLACEASH